LKAKGLVEHDGQWVTPDALKEVKNKVRYLDQWVTPEDKKLLESRKYASRRGWSTFRIANLQKALSPPDWICPETLYLLLFLLVTVVSFAFAVQEILNARNEISICFLIFSTMPFFMTEIMWMEPWGYSRVFLPSAVFLVLSFVRSGRNAYLIPLTIHGLLFAVALKWLYVI